MSKKSLNEVLKQITPLPWYLPESEGPAFARNIITDNSNKLVGMTLAGFDGSVPAEINATYLTHAANVLPGLVEVLKPDRLIAWASHIERTYPGIASDLRDMAKAQCKVLESATNISIS
jgi:hypothetical protein